MFHVQRAHPLQTNGLDPLGHPGQGDPEIDRHRQDFRVNTFVGRFDGPT
jgi:hypothetical protein